VCLLTSFQYRRLLHHSSLWRGQCSLNLNERREASIHLENLHDDSTDAALSTREPAWLHEKGPYVRVHKVVGGAALLSVDHSQYIGGRADGHGYYTVEPSRVLYFEVPMCGVMFCCRTLWRADSPSASRCSILQVHFLLLRRQVPRVELKKHS
jgi:hypothetical protein